MCLTRLLAYEKANRFFSNGGWNQITTGFNISTELAPGPLLLEKGQVDIGKSWNLVLYLLDSNFSFRPVINHSKPKDHDNLLFNLMTPVFTSHCSVNKQVLTNIRI